MFNNTKQTQWTPQQYIETRIQPELEELAQKAKGNLRCYRRVNRYGIYSTLLIPILVFLWHMSPQNNGAWLQILIVVISLLSIALNSLKFLGQYVEDANKYNMQKSLIEKELTFYLTRTQGYELDESLPVNEADQIDNVNFSNFIRRVEQILSY